ncbi:site-specific integrase [Rudaea sp.]|uniref:site-specific integrase n=1 Tax=Rudaea sp. TaxID=2136325 RepID=UPI0039C9DA54
MIGVFYLALTDEFRVVTRAHVLAWRKTLEDRTLSGATIRRKLAALSSLFEYLCEQNAGSRSIVACEREAVVTSLTKPPSGCVLTASAIRFPRRATTKLQPARTVARRKVRCALPTPACQ